MRFESPSSTELGGQSGSAGHRSARAALPLAETQARRLLELRLLQLFVTKVSHTLPGSFLLENRQKWINDIPQLAIDHEPLLHAMFSLTISYITTTNQDFPLSKQELLIHRAHYLGSALKQHRQSIRDMKSESAAQTAYTAILLSTDAISDLRNRSLDPYGPPLSWMKMNQGAHTVLLSAIQLGKFEICFNSYSKSNCTSGNFDMSGLRSEANMQYFPYLLRLFHDTVSDEDWQVYTDAVCFIAAADIARESGEHPNVLASRVVFFPAYIKPRFVQLLTMLRPRSLAILAHLIAISSSVKNCWIIERTPVREINAIHEYLGPEWSQYTEWPMNMVRQMSEGA